MLVNFKTVKSKRRWESVGKKLEEEGIGMKPASEWAEEILDWVFDEDLSVPSTKRTIIAALEQYARQAHAEGIEEGKKLKQGSIWNLGYSKGYTAGIEKAAKVVETEHKVCLPLMCETARKVRALSKKGE